MKNKKIIMICMSILIIFIMVLELTSYSSPMPPFMYSPPNEEQQVEKQEKLVIDTINTRDISKVKGLFSKNALAKIDDIDGKLKEFLIFTQGNYVSSKYS